MADKQSVKKITMDETGRDTVSVAVATRTLLAAGFDVTGCQRQPEHAEIQCERVSLLGASVRYTLAITNNEKFTVSQMTDIERIARNDGRTMVLVGAGSEAPQISWTEFLEAMGGAVPSWRALTPDYGDHLMMASRNELPKGLNGEAWLLFEDLIADGLEFVYGRRVTRLGGRKRGRLVSDMLAQLPDARLMVVDAKASGDGFDATWPNLRALAEYVARQKERQRGHNEVFCALVVSSEFQQHEGLLYSVSRTFYAETSVTLAFLSADTLNKTINVLTNDVGIRNAIRWRQILSGGLVTWKQIDSERMKAHEERYQTGRD